MITLLKLELLFRIYLENPLEENSTPDDFSRKFTRGSSEQVRPSSQQYCFFCGKETDAGKSLRKATTLDLDFRVRNCALQLQE